jgi:uncharacterized protein (DUF736 family)
METNMIIGTFTYDENTDRFEGDIHTLSFQLTGVVIATTEKNNPEGPDYRVTARTATGQVELGAAWKRTSDRGRDFISVSLDAPLLAAPVNAALFLDKNETEASLVWNRKKPKATEQASTDEAPSKEAA